jgi:hypothetical protein
MAIATNVGAVLRGAHAEPIERVVVTKPNRAFPETAAPPGWSPKQALSKLEGQHCVEEEQDDGPESRRRDRLPRSAEEGREEDHDLSGRHRPMVAPDRLHPDSLMVNGRLWMVRKVERDSIELIPVVRHEPFHAVIPVDQSLQR